jgi:hypothetical protein
MTGKFRQQHKISVKKQSGAENFIVISPEVAVISETF